MSARMVSPWHIGALVQTAVADGVRGQRPGDPEPIHHCFPASRGGWRRVRREDENYLGAMLTAACRRSVMHRYDGELPGHPWTPDDEYDHTLFRPRRKFEVAEIACLLDGYEYQACEAPDWGSSEAAQFGVQLRRALLRRLDGYSDAPWLLDRETAHAERPDRRAPAGGTLR